MINPSRSVNIIHPIPRDYKSQRLRAWEQLSFQWAEHAERNIFHRTALEHSARRVSDVIQKENLSEPALVDMGCGPGTLLARLGADSRFRTLVGIDFCPAMLELARAKSVENFAAIEYFLIDLERYIPGQESGLAHKFQIATAVFLTDEVEDLGACFRSAAHLLSPGGVLMVTSLVPERERVRYASLFSTLPRNGQPVLLSKNFGNRRGQPPFFRIIRKPNELKRQAQNRGFRFLSEEMVDIGRRSGPPLPTLKVQLFRRDYK